MNEEQTAWLQSIAQAAVELQSERFDGAGESLLFSDFLKRADEELHYWLDMARELASN